MLVLIAYQVILLNLIQINSALNVSNLLDMYSSVCGKVLCDRSLTKHSFDVKNDFSCPKCTCDISCMHDGTCCLDIFLQLQPKCIESTLLTENKTKRKNKRFLMINTCPVGSNETIKHLCETINYSNEELVKNVPVTSGKSGLTYRNVYCSQCFNESRENLRSWNWEMNCPQKAERADFNFLSSFNELFDLAKERQCSIYYRHTPGMQISSCDLLGVNVTNTCNISGTWQEYDSDVDYACQTYNNRFESFKNVFCYICNPPHPNKRVIKHCNVSGLWAPYDSDLEKACSNTRHTTTMGSYKNIYCYLCNRNNTKLNNGPIFSDNTVNLISKSSRNGQGQYIFDYSITGVDILQIIKRSQVAVFSTKTTALTTDSLMATGNKTKTDLLNLLKHYYKYTGFAHFCHNYSIFNNLSSCSCSDSCYFNNSGCCIDKMLVNITKAIKCTNEMYSTDRFRYTVYRFCETQKDSVLNKLCDANNNDDPFTFLPVQATTNTGDSIQYKNIFCVLCNKPAEYQAWHGYLYNFPFLFWTFRIVCDVYVPIKYHVLFEDYINYAKQNKCKFFYEPVSSTNARQCGRKTLTKCNKKRKWKSFENDISVACKYLNYESLDFCFSLCNYVTNDASVDFSGMHVPPTIWNPDLHSLRNLFVFSNFEKETQVEAINKQCNESQFYIYHTNDCRNIKCFPGRIRTNRGCIPLLENTTDLGYIISIGIKGTLVKTIDNTPEFVQAIRNTLKKFLRVLLQTSALIESTYILSNLPCSVSSKWENESHVWISFYQKIFLDQYVNRSLIEERLVSLPNTKLNVSYRDIVQSFVLTKDENAYYLPTLEDKSKLAGKCFLKTKTEIKNKNKNRKAEFIMHSHVNNLLLCEQIELNESEFTLSSNNLKLSLPFVATELNYNEYILVSFNKARLCLNTIINLGKDIDDQNTQNVLDILQIGCMCISLICLLCTFATYCFFPSMRSMPGKSNMCLIFSMFWANFIFHFITLGKKSEIGCNVLGVLIHYFWLATFACLSVCSYHMYMVFTSKTGAHFSEKRQLMTYIIYSFVFPVIVVAANCVITAIVLGDSSIGYGGNLCFLKEMIAFIVTFIIPITLICVSNLFFFISTSVTIARTPKVKTEGHNRVKQIHFTVYVKLFTITGISWIFQIIDSFLPMSAFSIIVSIMNTLQGTFIFASYILNKRVLQLYKNAGKSVYEYSRSRSNSSNKRTMNTELKD